MDTHDKLDEGVKETFPASDAVAETQPHTHGEEVDPTVTKRMKPRSADWMYEKKAPGG
jgi:hypothetical protein